MKKHLITIIPFALTLLLQTACGGGKGDIDELRKLKEDACACKDKKCGDAVNKKLDAKLEKMKQPSKEDEDTVAQLMAGAGLCLSKFTE
jgi:hypothetical protein